MIHTVLSQNDPRWKLKRLGFGTGTIGNYGCTLTCVSMLLHYYGHSYLPDMLNDALKSSDGFVGSTKNILNWLAVPKLVPSLTYGGSVNAYDDAAVKKYLERKQPIIIRVDAEPIGAPRSDHFVVAIGDGKIADPWDGKIKAFSTYTPTGYRLLVGTPGGGAIQNPDEICIKKATFEDLVTKASAFDALKAVGIEKPSDIQAIRDREQEARNGEKTALEQAEGTRKSMEAYQQRVAEALQSTQDIDRVVAAITEILLAKDTAEKSLKKATDDLSKQEPILIELRAEVERLKLVLKSNKSLETATLGEIFEEFARRIMALVRKG